ncbi:MAG: hypothetical protein GX916_09275 [Clostridiales bacterium]|nr:hypothetical protein [Clostridiales bacterium]
MPGYRLRTKKTAMPILGGGVWRRIGIARVILPGKQRDVVSVLILH